MGALRRSALRRSGGEKPNRLGEDEAINPKTQKPKNPKTQKPKNPKTSTRAPRWAAELRGGNFYAFPRALVVEDARSLAGPQYRRAFIVAIRRRRIGAARLFSRVVRSRHRRNSAAETGRVSL